MRRSLYSLGIRCYRLFVKIASIRNSKAKKLIAGQRSTFPYLLDNVDPVGGYIWIHASSLGEFEQGRPLIESIKEKYPHKKIALTFFSPSGYEVRKNYEKADIICYLPFDTPGNVARFLDTIKPSVAIFIKYEFWGNYLHQLHKRNIPTYIISAIFRPKQRFFRRYGGFFRNMLRCFTHLYVQDSRSKELLAKHGIDNVTVAGDTRFDRVADIYRQAKELPLVEKFSQGGNTLIAGSSWPKDEEIFIDYFNRHPEQKLIIAPHEIHEEHLSGIIAKLQRPYLRYTQANDENIATADCLIIDCFGLLSSIYQYGTTAYIGGGFGAGIHNVPEAAVYGIPVIFGPNYQKFREAKALIANGGAFSIADTGEYDLLMQRFEADSTFHAQCGKTAGEYIHGNTGATALILEELATKLQ